MPLVPKLQPLNPPLITATAANATATAKSLWSCPTLCDPIDGSPPGSSVPGILQARILEWVAISFSNAWKWKVKVKSLSRAQLQWPHGLQPTRLLHPWDFPGKSTGVGCHCLLLITATVLANFSVSASCWQPPILRACCIFILAATQPVWSQGSLLLLSQVYFPGILTFLSWDQFPPKLTATQVPVSGSTFRRK